MALPIVGQKNSSQVRMAVEDDAEQIERFAFVPVGCAPDAGDGRHVRVVFVQQNFQTQAMMLRCRKQMIVDFETRIFFDPRSAPQRSARKSNVASGPVFRAQHTSTICSRGTIDRHFAERFDDLGDPVRVLTLQRRHQLGRR